MVSPHRRYRAPPLPQVTPTPVDDPPLPPRPRPVGRRSQAPPRPAPARDTPPPLPAPSPQIPETEKERSTLDFPQEWMTPPGSNRPGIFPEFERLKTPDPKPMPGDPEMPDENELQEEEERKRREPEPGDDEPSKPGEEKKEKEEKEEKPEEESGDDRPQEVPTR